MQHTADQVHLRSTLALKHYYTQSGNSKFPLHAFVWIDHMCSKDLSQWPSLILPSCCFLFSAILFRPIGDSQSQGCLLGRTSLEQASECPCVLQWRCPAFNSGKLSAKNCGYFKPAEETNLYPWKLFEGRTQSSVEFEGFLTLEQSLGKIWWRSLLEIQPFKDPSLTLRST